MVRHAGHTTGLAVISLILLVSETQSACLRGAVPAVNQNPYLPRGPGDSSASAVSAEAFGLLENRHKHLHCVVHSFLYQVTTLAILY